MKKFLFLSFVVLMSLTTFSQSKESDKIIGTYISEGNKGKVVITKQGNIYIGTLVWTNEPNAVDKNNPDKSKRNNKVEGMVILKNLTYAGNYLWENGTIYDLESGDTYSCEVNREPNGNLSLHGYVGFSLFGRTTYWTRQ